MPVSPELEPLPPVAERNIGRWTFTLPGFSICAGGIALIMFSGEKSATSSLESTAQWAVISLVAIAAFGVYVLALARLTPFRHRGDQTIALWITVIAAVGATSLVSIITSWGASVMGTSTTLDFWPRLLAMATLGSALGLAALMFLDRFDRSRRNLAVLVELQVANELVRISQAILLQEIRDELREEIDVELDSSRVRVQERLAEVQSASDTESLMLVTAELRAMAEGSIRPLSARLWSDASKEQPRVSWWSLLTETIRQEPFHPLALILIHLLGSFGQNVILFGTPDAIVSAVSAALTIAVITLGANAFMRRYPQSHALIFVVTIAILQLSVIPTAIWRDAQVPGSGSAGWVIAQIIAGIVVIFATSGVGAWSRVQEELVEERGRVLSDAKAQAQARSRIVADLARETSQVLHGSVQTRLVACAMTTERAIAENNIDLLTVALVEARRILDSAHLHEAPVSTLHQEVDRKVQLWVELCDITVAIDPRLSEGEQGAPVGGPDISTVVASTVGRVIEEGVSNAIRHGDAHRIEISIDLVDDSSIQVMVTDNGTGVISNGPGMGSAFLTQATHGSWTLASLPDGAQLTASVPISLVSP